MHRVSRSVSYFSPSKVTDGKRILGLGDLGFNSINLQEKLNQVIMEEKKLKSGMEIMNLLQ
ncbi:hypothetical protein MKX01_024834, partial [Papaver californicum]